MAPPVRHPASVLPIQYTAVSIYSITILITLRVREDSRIHLYSAVLSHKKQPVSPFDR